MPKWGSNPLRLERLPDNELESGTSVGGKSDENNGHAFP